MSLHESCALQSASTVHGRCLHQQMPIANDDGADAVDCAILELCLRLIWSVDINDIDINVRTCCTAHHTVCHSARQARLVVTRIAGGIEVAFHAGHGKHEKKRLVERDSVEQFPGYRLQARNEMRMTVSMTISNQSATLLSSSNMHTWW